MALPNSNFSDIIATTLQGYSGKLADNVSKSNVLWKEIDRKGNKMVATGRSIVQELEYASNASVMYYSGAQTFDISSNDTFTAAEFNYKQLVGAAVINGLEEIQNSGKEAVHNLLKSRISNLEKSLKNTAGAGTYAPGTGSNGLEIGGLQLLVADVPTNTVGNISGSSQTFWKNQVYSFTTASVTASSTTIQHAMNTIELQTTRGKDIPDLWVADQIYWIYYLESLQPQQRFTDDKGAGAGFKNLTFMARAPVVYDDQCPASHMYALNTDYLFLRPAKGKEFVPLREKSAVNQDAIVMPMVWAGNMTVSNRARQGVIIA